VTPGRRKTTRCEKRVEGRLKRKEDGAGAALGVVMRGLPVGRTPKSWGRVVVIVCGLRGCVRLGGWWGVAVAAAVAEAEAEADAVENNRFVRGCTSRSVCCK